MLPLSDRDRGTRRVWEEVLGVAIVLTCLAILAYSMHAELWFRNTTTNGGDMGAHVWWPATLRDHWFGRGRLSGWSPDWYVGFPVGQFYFPFPAISIVALELLTPLSYNVAFKLVAVSGAMMLPVAAYTLARAMRFAWPAPPLFAVAATRSMFEVRLGMGDQGGAGHTIFGGNLPSILAGEFSYTIGLSMCLFFLAALASSLRTGRRRWLPAVLLAATVTSHIVIALVAAIGALVVWVFHRPIRTFFLTAGIGLTGALLSVVWWLPVLATQAYTTSMRYEKKDEYAEWLIGVKSGTGFPAFPQPLWLWFLILVAVVMAAWWQRLNTLALVVTTVLFGVLFWQWPQDHHVWNARFLPIYYLGLALTAAVGAAELSRIAGFIARWSVGWIREGDRLDEQRLAELAARESATEFAEPELGFAEVDGPELVAANPVLFLSDDGMRAEAAVHPIEAVTAESGAESLPGSDAPAPSELDEGPSDPLPPARKQTTDAARDRHARFWFDIVTASTLVVITFISLIWIRGFPADDSEPNAKHGLLWNMTEYFHSDNRWATPGWAKWNFTGYEGQKAFPEYREIMRQLGDLPAGRLLWEPAAGNPDWPDAYGTSLSLELIPYFTDGRIGSMEGLYFEAASTTPYHFLTVAELADRPSNPVRGLLYGNLEDDFDIGIKHLQMLGVRYYMIWSEDAIRKADAADALKPVLTIPAISRSAMVDKFGAAEGEKWNGWRVYEVKDTALVEGLKYEPVVATNLRGGTTSQCFEQAGDYPLDAKDPEAHIVGWECAATAWWRDAAALDQLFAKSGPADWQRVDARWNRCRNFTDYPQRKGVDRPCVSPYRALTSRNPRKLAKVEVSDVRQDVDSISFDVDRIGVPVLVKASYFPNWRVDGASGPYPVSPSLMVVVPNQRHVSLTYGLTAADWGGRIAWVFGLAGLVLLVLVRPRFMVRSVGRRWGRRGREDSDFGARPEPVPEFAWADGSPQRPHSSPAPGPELRLMDVPDLGNAPASPASPAASAPRGLDPVDPALPVDPTEPDDPDDYGQ